MKDNYLLLSFFSLLAFSLYQFSCTADKLPEPMAGAECDTFDATYDGDIKAIIDASCALTGCHVSGGGAPGVFQDFSGLLDFANNGPNGLRDRVIVLANDPDNGMPPDWNTNPGPKNLTEEQLKIFKCWVDSGFPEN